jgi:hypothetical protein
VDQLRLNTGTVHSCMPCKIPEVNIADNKLG